MKNRNVLIQNELSRLIKNNIFNNINIIIQLYITFCKNHKS